MRLRKKPGALEKLQAYPEIIPPEPHALAGKWQEKIHGDLVSPLHVELGTGKGQFLHTMAKRFPTISFIGVEKYESVLDTALDRYLDLPRERLRFIHGDVEDVEQFFAPGEVTRIYLNFTDPWPKKKHAKRRLTHPSFLERYRTILHKEGEIHLKTDNEAYFTYALESFSQTGFYLRNISLDLHRNEPEENVRTEYEQRYAERGQRIFRVEAALSI